MMIESLGAYIIKCIRKLQKENIASMVVKRARQDDFIAYVDEYFKGTVFSDDCRSWYKNKGVGEVTGLWPGSTLHCIEALRSPRWEDYVYVYVGEEEDGHEDEECLERKGGVVNGVNGTTGKKRRRRVNRLAWLGNGFTRNELEGKDLAWYLYPQFCEKPVAPLPEEKEEFSIRTFSY
jgi:hypothetical protein